MTRTRIASLFAALTALVASPVLANDGLTVPPPVFQTGDTPSQPLPEGGAEAQGFVDFFNKTYLKEAQDIPLLTRDQVVWFPPQSAGDTSLELVVRSTEGNPPNCNPGDPGYPPQGYPIVCRDDFSTGEFCQACHDSALFVEGGGLPEMMYSTSRQDHDQWLVNWSQYGDWSANIMRLATRDPIWQAQIETETNKHPYADPHVVQDVCFSCHGEMGERQVEFDFGTETPFCTDLFYATLPGILSDHERGKPFPFDPTCAPIAGKPVGDHPELYAKYGSLARDGVSCETCHRIGKPNEGGRWTPTDDPQSYDVFYGPNKYDVAMRQPSEQKLPLQHEFTATFDYDMETIMTPDPLEMLDAAPMLDDDNLVIAQAIDTTTGTSYLRQAVLCGTCHVLIVPEIPTSYKPGAPLPDSTPELKAQYPYYDRPAACSMETTTFAPATRGDYGNPLTDPCVTLGYEQATYLEWINSDFASEEDNGNTCQGCHMPLVTNPANGDDHTAILAQSTQGLTAKTYRRHRLMGINLPVFEMFVQFPDVLGVSAYNDNVPDYATTSMGEEMAVIQNYLLNGQMAIVDQATSQANGTGLPDGSTTVMPQAAVELTLSDVSMESGTVNATVLVTNNAGHKFPSGAGFRRGILKVEVLDAGGATLWVSGAVNPYGAICSGPCVPNGDGTWNLLPSETPAMGLPANLQPHHTMITDETQAQIYEVQAIDDTGHLTSRTLALFHDAKDNRILPRGFASAEALGCTGEPGQSQSIFGIERCTAAYATGPQIESLVTGSQIADDPYYSDPALAGADEIAYQITLPQGAAPASIRVSMQYQTIPPGFLAGRFKDGYVAGEGFLPATERSIYLTSHLNTNLPLTSAHPDNEGVLFTKDWTTTIFTAEAALD
ncbi:hypothetical protein ACN2XU_14645 [Primorskyibacter sp. 2E107]|uniref:hypothetical protein n=1 Tax=Primorskyibacter sp. 2E107 TaxID=3403458 RepID=UPI003AF6D0A2